ncbi:MAG: hypothetical protein QME85_01015 [Candidatus Saccharicenans sp.]|nr:hypothetical protein [Candidatus Saccharicenans sp.]MDI6850228.1 hypothetical protein [Candidatus Saccharicenans sp.]
MMTVDKKAIIINPVINFEFFHLRHKIWKKKTICQAMISFRHRHGIQGKGSIRERRSGEPAVGKDLEEARGLIKLALEKAGLPPLKVLLKLLTERRKPKPK